MLANFQLIGRLGVDPEIRYTANGKPVALARVACTHRYKGDEETSWFSVQIYGTENSLSLLRKGTLLYLSGRMSYTKKDDRYYLNLYATEFKMLSPSKDKGADPAADIPSKASEGVAITDDDIPF
jgi:single-strand DNA-binding protein